MTRTKERNFIKKNQKHKIRFNTSSKNFQQKSH